MRIHPITGLFLEDGFGALSDDLQAIRNHIPYIRQQRGDAAADAMLAKIASAAPPAPEPVAEPSLEPAIAEEQPEHADGAP